MSVQKFIFPGVLFGIFSLLVFTRLVSMSSINLNNFTASGAGAAQAAPLDEATGNVMTGCSLSQSYPASILQWCGLIERYARENGIDPDLVSAVMLQESSGRPDAYSKSGAVGLLQVMPRDGRAANFICTNGPCFSSRPSMSDLFDPGYNIAYGTQMLGRLIHEQGSLREALRAYGPMDVGYDYADLVIGSMNNHH